MENTADISHFNTIHSVPEFLGTLLKKAPFYDLILKYFHIEYEMKYKVCAEPYVSQLRLVGTYHLGPFQTQFVMKTNAIGPNSFFNRIYKSGEVFIIDYTAVISDGPLKHRIVHHLYSKKNSLLSYLMSLYVCHFISVNV